jgi:ATP-binding cassette, subfamily B, multidrug efflux pump
MESYSPVLGPLMDKILVLHKGTLREMGTHQELLALGCIYYKLYQLQYKDQEAAA